MGLTDALSTGPRLPSPIMGRAGGRKLCRVLVAGLLACGPAAAGADEPEGTTTEGSFEFNGSTYPYLLHAPASYREQDPVPLVVVIHGCQTTAEAELKVTRYNDLAEEEGFAVLYPDVEDIGRNAPGPIANCWLFANPAAYFRGHGDSEAIAQMTRSVMGRMSIDTERVYAVGVSAGGLMTAALAATHSDLFAAVGLVVSAGYADGTCFANGVGSPVVATSQLAFAQMAGRERVVPLIAMGSDGDLAFPANCTVKAVEQSLRTNNLVLSGSQDGPLALEPATTTSYAPPGRFGYDVSTFEDPDGCLVAERWIIHGMPHAYPGETALGASAAPSATTATWDFLSRYRRSDTALPCAETTG